MSRIKELRQTKNYMQRKMQELTGIHQKTYSRLERGQQTFTTTQCILIANALEPSTGYILGLTDVVERHK